MGDKEDWGRGEHHRDDLTMASLRFRKGNQRKIKGKPMKIKGKTKENQRNIKGK